MPTTLDALLIVALFLTPGFIFTQLVRRTVAYVAESTDTRFFLMIISASLAIHGLIARWSSRIFDFWTAKTLPANRVEVFFWSLVTIFLLPIFLAIVFGRLSKVIWLDKLLAKINLGYNDRIPSAWEFVIRKREPAYVRVFLKDGKGTIAGVYQDQSFGSFPPGKADIYLETQWQLDGDGNFHMPILDSRGVWISAEAISYVEFLNKEEEPDATATSDAESH